MKKEMFYQMYADTPLSDRFGVINFQESGIMTLNDLYQKLKELDKQMQSPIRRQDKLLKLADQYYIFKTAKIKKNG